MSASVGAMAQTIDDRVGNVLKWVLLATAIICFGIMAWATEVTYRTAPPMPDHFLAPDGSVLMTSASIEAGKGAFQRADLMDYGSLYGMGSYFGEDYTAQYLVSLAQLTEDNLARTRDGRPFAVLGPEEQLLVRDAMRRQLQGIDLSGGRDVHLTAAVASALRTLQPQIASQLLHHDFIRGWTQAYSLDAQSAVETADFILYSALTCVARRPGLASSWTQNWPYEPLVGNTPSTATFLWTWISFCFTFFCFGAVLFAYHRYLRGVDRGVMDPVLAAVLISRPRPGGEVSTPVPSPDGLIAVQFM